MFSSTPNYGFTSTGEEIQQPLYQINKTSRLSSIIAIGNPIVDISAEIDRESILRYNLVWGGTFFANESNIGFYEELESKPQVSYIPGGKVGF